MIEVLIVEDQVRIAEIHRRFVDKVGGFQVSGIATDTSQAWDLAEILEPDLVLLDLYLPDSAPFELLRRLKGRTPAPDVIMITAAQDVPSVREAIRGGVFDYIVKPVIYDRFRETMEAYRTFRSKLDALSAGTEAVDQRQIDELLRSGGATGGILGGSFGSLSGGGIGSLRAVRDNVPMPKGIDGLTLEKVTAYITAQPEPLTAEQVSTGVGISRSTARRYLEYLVSQCLITTDLNYGTVGRPERVYRQSRGETRR